MSDETPDEYHARKAHYYEFYNAELRFWNENFTYMEHRKYGFPLGMTPDVYKAHPYVSFSSILPMLHMGDLTGKDVLDVGCGSGVISVAAAYQKANSVVACDISENAVKLAKHNAQLNGFGDKIEVLQSDVLDSVITTMPGRKFDLVVANLWFPIIHENYPEDTNNTALNCYRKFLGSVFSLMKPDGIAYLTSGEFANVEGTQEVFAELDVGYNLLTVTVPVLDMRVNAQMYSFNAQRDPATPWNSLKPSAP